MIVRLAVQAMYTRFELVLLGEDESRLVAVGEEAIAEIEACEDRLSLFRPGSLLSIINRDAATRPVGLDRDTFALLLRAQHLHRLTEGTFDPTIAPLMKLWCLHGSASSAADPASFDAARECVGMHLVELDAARHTVRFTRPGVSLDLGGLAKGHALALAHDALRRVGFAADSSGTEAAFLHAGTSSVTAIGAPPGHPGWRVAISNDRLAHVTDPSNSGGCAHESAPHESAPPHESTPFTAGLPCVTICLKDRSLSVSAPASRTLGRVHHIMDPRTGRSAIGASLAAAVSPCPLEAEALSTAMVVLNRRPCLLDPDTPTVLCCSTDPNPWRIQGAHAANIVYLSSSSPHPTRTQDPP